MLTKAAMNRCTFTKHNKEAHKGLQTRFASSQIEWHARDRIKLLKTLAANVTDRVA